MNSVISIIAKLLCICMCVTLLAAQDAEPNLPSHLPSPPDPPKPKPRPTTRPVATTTSTMIAPMQNSEIEDNTLGDYYREDETDENNYEDENYEDNGIEEEPPVPPPPQISPEPPPPPPPEEEPEPPPHRAIFGLDHIILIVVPQFKAELLHLPSWAGSNVKVSLPITVFFDQLKVPQPPLVPVSIVPLYGPFFPNGHYVKKRSILLDSEQKDLPQGDQDNDESKETPRPPPNPRRSLDETIYRAERVMLIPRLEKLLGSFGLGGKPCLLRAICETHEVPLVHHGYGLLGEVLTLFFSISRSSFADTHHLSEYLKAEEAGKVGDCSMYFDACPSSIFYWEKTHHHPDNHLGINASVDDQNQNPADH